MKYLDGLPTESSLTLHFTYLTLHMKKTYGLWIVVLNISLTLYNQLHWKYLLNAIVFITHILYLPAAYVYLPLEGMSGDFSTPGFLNLLNSFYQREYYYTMSSPLVQTLDLGVVWRRILRKIRKCNWINLVAELNS